MMVRDRVALYLALSLAASLCGIVIESFPCPSGQTGLAFARDATRQTLFAIRTETGWGLIDSTGAIVHPPDLDGLPDVQPMIDFLTMAGQHGQPNLWMLTGEISLSTPVRAVSKGRLGLIGADGSWLLEPRFRDLKWHEDAATVAMPDDVWGVLDHSFEFHPGPGGYIHPFRGQRFAVIQDDRKRFGIVDTRGSIVLPIGEMVGGDPYGTPPDLAERRVPFTAGAKFGFKDLAGTVVVPAIYDEVRDFSSGMAAVRVGEHWGFIDSTGVLAVQPAFKNVWPFERQIAAAGDERLGLIRRDGSWLIPPRLERASRGWPGWHFMESGLEGFASSDGARVIPASFANLDMFFDGLAVAARETNGPEGYVDTTGAWVIEPRFASAGRFSCDRASFRFRWEDPVGYIDRTGTVVIAPRFSDAHRFAGGAAVAVSATGDTLGYIDTRGEFIWFEITPGISRRGK